MSRSSRGARYPIDVSASSVLVLCPVCRTRALVNTPHGARLWARDHELQEHPGEVYARDTLNQARARRRTSEISGALAM